MRGAGKARAPVAGERERIQAGGRKGASCRLAWNAFVTNVDSGSAAGQVPFARVTGRVATCGAAQPQSQLAPPQQSPSCAAKALVAPIPFNKSRATSNARNPVTPLACAGQRPIASQPGSGVAGEDGV